MPLANALAGLRSVVIPMVYNSMCQCVKTLQPLVENQHEGEKNLILSTTISTTSFRGKEYLYAGKELQKWRSEQEVSEHNCSFLFRLAGSLAWGYSNEQVELGAAVSRWEFQEAQMIMMSLWEDPSLLLPHLTARLNVVVPVKNLFKPTSCTTGDPHKLLLLIWHLEDKTRYSYETADVFFETG